MSVELLEVNGIRLDVYYEFNFIVDKFNLCDDSVNYTFKITSVEPQFDVVNFLPLLSEAVLEEIESRIFEIESDKIRYDEINKVVA